MPKRPAKSAADFIPPRPTLKTARDAAKGCRGCDLWKTGTQTVFGECLGATAARTLLGSRVKVTRRRGAFVPSLLAPRVLATVHPSSILRAPDAEARRREMQRFVDDLRAVARELSSE
jgi:uracil-DNA glycosylase